MNVANDESKARNKAKKGHQVEATGVNGNSLPKFFDNSNNV